MDYEVRKKIDVLKMSLQELQKKMQQITNPHSTFRSEIDSIKEDITKLRADLDKK
jgi:uncharacterized coiled-coil DUF342 family protein